MGTYLPPSSMLPYNPLHGSLKPQTRLRGEESPSTQMPVSTGQSSLQPTQENPFSLKSTIDCFTNRSRPKEGNRDIEMQIAIIKTPLTCNRSSSLCPHTNECLTKEKERKREAVTAYKMSLALQLLPITTMRGPASATIGATKVQHGQGSRRCRS